MKNTTSNHPHHNEESSKRFVHHQSRIVVDQTLLMLERLDDMHAALRVMARDCHNTLRLHASLDECLKRNEGGVVPGEGGEEENEEEEGEIKVGDVVYCTCGRELGGTQGCTVVEVSPSKKTFVLLDHRGRHYRKYRKCIAKKY